MNAPVGVEQSDAVRGAAPRCVLARRRGNKVVSDDLAERRLVRDARVENKIDVRAERGDGHRVQKLFALGRQLGEVLCPDRAVRGLLVTEHAREQPAQNVLHRNDANIGVGLVAPTRVCDHRRTRERVLPEHGEHMADRVVVVESDHTPAFALRVDDIADRGRPPHCHRIVDAGDVFAIGVLGFFVRGRFCGC
eukprot:Amastigsp_a515657_20.p2 type:complete len:193 gc:universal Amastigsp_a515657_20:637-59(-)